MNKRPPAFYLTRQIVRAAARRVPLAESLRKGFNPRRRPDPKSDEGRAAGRSRPLPLNTFFAHLRTMCGIVPAA